MVPEDELCLLLSRGQLSPGVQRRALELLSKPLQWKLLLERTTDHQVLPLIYHSLRILEFHRVPPEVRAQVKTAFRTNAVRNEFLVRELGRVLELLEKARIPVIPLKGVILAELLYGDPALHVCWDLDLLVPRGEVLRTRRLILAHGYTSPFPEEFFVRHQFHTSADCPLLPQIERAVLPYLLELHWTLLQHSSQDEEAMQDLWSLARPKEFFGVQAYSLTPEWEFLYLAVHAAYHKWQTLKWLADIHELCVTTSIDWPQVREKAARFELDSVVGPTLTACSSLFGTPKPPDFPTVPLPPRVRLFPDSLSYSEAWKAPLFYPRLLKRPSEKLHWFLEILFIARLADRRLFRLPSTLSFLYYALRPLRLSCKWTWLFAQAACRRLRQTRPSPTPK